MSKLLEAKRSRLKLIKDRKWPNEEISSQGCRVTKRNEKKIFFFRRLGRSLGYASSHGGAEGERYSSEFGDSWSESSDKKEERSG